MRAFPVAVALLALAACTTQEEIAARDAASCENLGFKPGTDAFANCRLQLAIERRQAIGAAMDHATEQLQQQQPASPSWRANPALYPTPSAQPSFNTTPMPIVDTCSMMSCPPLGP